MRFIHTLHFQTRSDLRWAFDQLASEEWVEDCLVEPDELRLRLVAPRDTASALLERLNAGGGLTWATRVPFPTPGCTGAATDADER